MKNCFSKPNKEKHTINLQLDPNNKDVQELSAVFNKIDEYFKNTLKNKINQYPLSDIKYEPTSLSSNKMFDELCKINDEMSTHYQPINHDSDSDSDDLFGLFSDGLHNTKSVKPPINNDFGIDYSGISELFNNNPKPNTFNPFDLSNFDPSRLSVGPLINNGKSSSIKLFTEMPGGERVPLMFQIPPLLKNPLAPVYSDTSSDSYNDSDSDSDNYSDTDIMFDHFHTSLNQSVQPNYQNPQLAVLSYSQLEELIGDKVTDPCCICLDEFNFTKDNAEYTLLECSHVFHLLCIQTHYKQCNKYCPVCRK